MSNRPGDEVIGGWLLQCNPDTFDVEALHRSGRELESWRVRHSKDKIAAGDPFVLWLSGPRGGVLATGTITGPARWVANPDPAFWRDPPEPADFVPLTINRWLPTILPHRTVRDDPEFASASIVRNAQMANPHKFSAAQWDLLMNKINAIG